MELPPKPCANLFESELGFMRISPVGSMNELVGSGNELVGLGNESAGLGNESVGLGSKPVCYSPKVIMSGAQDHQMDELAIWGCYYIEILPQEDSSDLSGF